MSTATKPFGIEGKAVSYDKGLPSLAARRLRPQPHWPILLAIGKMEGGRESGDSCTGMCEKEEKRRT
eukprot:2903175-Rhodomonas_salina.1